MTDRERAEKAWREYLEREHRQATRWLSFLGKSWSKILKDIK